MLNADHPGYAEVQPEPARGEVAAPGLAVQLERLAARLEAPEGAALLAVLHDLGAAGNTLGNTLNTLGNTLGAAPPPAPVVEEEVDDEPTEPSPVLVLVRRPGMKETATGPHRVS